MTLPVKKSLRAIHFYLPVPPANNLRHQVATIRAQALAFYLCNSTRLICFSLKMLSLQTAFNFLESFAN